MFFWEFPQRPKYERRRFGTQCRFHRPGRSGSMEPTVSSEMSAFILRTPGKFPKEHRLHSEHSESLKTTIYIIYIHQTRRHHS